MKLSMRLISTLILVFMISVATEMGPVTVEARTCESQSHKFKGKCISSTNCGNVCRTEGGFTGGICRGARSRCFCIRQC